MFPVYFVASIAYKVKNEGNEKSFLTKQFTVEDFFPVMLVLLRNRFMFKLNIN